LAAPAAKPAPKVDDDLGKKGSVLAALAVKEEKKEEPAKVIAVILTVFESHPSSPAYAVFSIEKS
jgi:hypothetical protein